MPKVGGKHYSYSKAGKAAAKKAAARTGKKMTYGSKMSYGAKRGGASAKRHPGERRKK